MKASISTETKAYIAGILDGEGWIGISKNMPTIKRTRKHAPGYQPEIRVSMCDEPAIRLMKQTWGGYYYLQKKSPPRRDIYTYRATTRIAESILRDVLPFLRVKKTQAKVVLQLAKLKENYSYGGRGARNRLTEPHLLKCETLYWRCRELNGFGLNGQKRTGWKTTKDGQHTFVSTK